MHSLRVQLGVILVGFLLLVSSSVTAMFLALQTQASDGLIINVAGRQRMLVQQMSKEALGVDQGEAQRAALRDSAGVFDATLQALIEGGPAPGLPGRAVEVPATREAEIQAALRRVQQTWAEYRSQVEVVATAEPGSPAWAAARRSLEALAPELAQRADDVVGLMDAASAQRALRLQWVQVIFFICALVLLAGGALVVQRRLAGPLQQLAHAAERIGHGDLTTPVAVRGSSEALALSRSLDGMRTQLRTSQAALQAWAAELEGRVAQRTRELVALNEISREISSRLDIGVILRSVTDKARQLLGGEVAALCLLNQTGQMLTLESASGPSEAVLGTRLAAQAMPAVQVLASDQALKCGSDDCRGACRLLAAPFQVSHMAAPLRVGDRVIGALCVGSRGAQSFPAETANLLTKLADSVAVALENARLYEQAERVAMLEERQRIASEMHDGVAQTLSFLELKTGEALTFAEAGRSHDVTGVLQRVRAAIVQASRETRQAITALHENPSGRLALQDQLTQLARELELNNPAVTFDLPPQPLFLSAAECEQALRVVREALLNAHHHAGAAHIAVHVEQGRDEVTVSVTDDGRGFDALAPAPAGGQHFGLSIMRARAARLGGRLNLASAPGSGAQVTLTWPIASSPQAAQPAPVLGR